MPYTLISTVERGCLVGVQQWVDWTHNFMNCDIAQAQVNLIDISLTNFGVSSALRGEDIDHFGIEMMPTTCNIWLWTKTGEKFHTKESCETRKAIFGRSVRASENMHVTPDPLKQSSSVRVRTGTAIS